MSRQKKVFRLFAEIHAKSLRKLSGTGAADAVPGKKRGKNSELSRKGGKIRMQIKQKQKPVFSENVKSECLRCAKLDTCSVRNVKWD